jgi:uncharacterized protein YjbI with pentapeptide repeats
MLDAEDVEGRGLRGREHGGRAESHPAKPMDPQIEAALIAGGVSIISLGGTVVVALRGFYATMQATRLSADQSHRDTSETLAAQRELLDKTLAEQRFRTLNERFTTAAEQLGSDKPAIRLAGVHAMAGLADDWEENRQTCVDVLCAYLRMPYEHKPGEDAPAADRLAFAANREVRHTVIRLITAHLRPSATTSWQGLDLDFTGVAFDGGDFSEARFSGGDVSFFGASFYDDEVVFDKAEFSGGTVNFNQAEFSGGPVLFFDAVFSGSDVEFGAEFSGSQVDFLGAVFSGGTVSFVLARISDGTLGLGAKFLGAEVDFDFSDISGGFVNLVAAQFSAGEISFGAKFSGGEVDFSEAEFSGGTVSFNEADFLGSVVSFNGAEFSGGVVDFGSPNDWSHPPIFDWPADSLPPKGVTLPPTSTDTPE